MNREPLITIHWEHIQSDSDNDNDDIFADLPSLIDERRRPVERDAPGPIPLTRWRPPFRPFSLIMNATNPVFVGAHAPPCDGEHSATNEPQRHGRG